ncbi:DUF547 domain-containing protein [Winogradskyella ursingii]|uniref:DUF547 domain-containing protein n=1 Tax=Winogradskyella ursingii TaxID=2686079 RepID=UPI0015CCE26C|nr:DUF547 domain-containing protein [Winogradskyella ursingii]
MKNIFLLLALITSIGISGQNLETFFSKTDTFLKNYVEDGKVNYEAIYTNPLELNKILRIAENISVDVSDENNYQAFWINAYNMATIKGVIDNYPTKSPLDNKGFFDKTMYDLGEKKVTLNDIENKLLRANFDEPRFHFVLVCGAVGCPPITNSAYMPSTLDKQLQTQTTKAINADFVKVNLKEEKIEVSEIMKWYKEDFTRNGSTEINFINQYRTEKIPENYKLNYYAYDWSLNDQ